MTEEQQKRESQAPQPDDLEQPLLQQKLPTEQQEGTDPLPNTNPITPSVSKFKGDNEEEGWGGGSKDEMTSARRGEEKESLPQPEATRGQPPGEPVNLIQSISTFLELSQGRIEELTGLLSEIAGTPLTTEMTCKWLDLEPQTEVIPYDTRARDLIEGLTEDPEDDPVGFIPTIELHNARLKRAFSMRRFQI